MWSVQLPPGNQTRPKLNSFLTTQSFSPSFPLSVNTNSIFLSAQVKNIGVSLSPLFLSFHIVKPGVNAIGFTFKTYPGHSQYLSRHFHRMHGLDPRRRKTELCSPIDLTNLVSIACCSPPVFPSPSWLGTYSKQESYLCHFVSDSFTYLLMCLLQERNQQHG